MGNVFGAIAIHAIWGCYPSCARFLTFRMELDPNILLFFSKVLSLLTLYALDKARSTRKSASGSESKQMELVITSGKENDDDKDTIELIDTPEFKSQRIKYLAMWAFVATMRAVLNMTSCMYTVAYNIAIVNSLSPLLSPVLEKIMLKSKPTSPPFLFKAIIGSVIGVVAISLGQSPYFEAFNISSLDLASTGSAEKHYFSQRDLVGVGIQLVSMVFSNVARMIMKLSEKYNISKEDLVQTQNVSTITVVVLLGFIFTGVDSFIFAANTITSSLGTFLVFAWLTWGIFSFAAMYQMNVVRSLGPTLYASFTSIRIIVSVVLSYFLLHEPVDNYLEFFGILIVVVIVSIFLAKLYFQTRLDKIRTIV